MNIREIVFNILYDIFINEAYSNITINKYLKKYNIKELDRRFIKNLVFGTIEKKYTLDYIISFFSKRKIANIDKKALIILEMGLYQLKYMSKVPAYAAVNESIELAKKITGHGLAKFITAVLRNYKRRENDIKFPERDKDLKEYLCINYSYPEWIVKRLLNNYDSDTVEKLLKSLSKKPKICYRINTLKTDKAELENILKSKGFKYEYGILIDEALYIDIKDVESNELYINGYIYVQDESSMLVSKILNPKQGDLIIDVCSAPGGKSTHVAQLINDEGEIISFDIYKHKIDLVNKNCKRLGINSVRTEIFDATKVNEKYINKADRVLVDVPCTGIGIIRKKPDIKLKSIDERDIEELNEIQYKILESSSKYVKKGGYLIYSTCTIGKEENQDIIDKFLKNNKNFKMIDITDDVPKNLNSDTLSKGYIQITPLDYGIDGFFISKMQKIE